MTELILSFIAGFIGCAVLTLVYLLKSSAESFDRGFNLGREIEREQTSRARTIGENYIAIILLESARYRLECASEREFLDGLDRGEYVSSADIDEAMGLLDSLCDELETDLREAFDSWIGAPEEAFSSYWEEVER